MEKTVSAVQSNITPPIAEVNEAGKSLGPRAPKNQPISASLPNSARCAYCKCRKDDDPRLDFRFANGELLCANCEWLLGAAE